MLQRCYGDAKRMMESLIACELAYINTNHPDFIDVSTVPWVQGAVGGARGRL
jgi:hypothetical protein